MKQNLKIMFVILSLAFNTGNMQFGSDFRVIGSAPKAVRLPKDVEVAIIDAAYKCDPDPAFVNRFFELLRTGRFQLDNRFKKFAFCYLSKTKFVDEKTGFFDIPKSSAPYPRGCKTFAVLTHCAKYTGVDAVETFFLRFLCFQFLTLCDPDFLPPINNTEIKITSIVKAAVEVLENSVISLANDAIKTFSGNSTSLMQLKNSNNITKSPDEENNSSGLPKNNKPLTDQAQNITKQNDGKDTNLIKSNSKINNTQLETNTTKSTTLKI